MEMEWEQVAVAPNQLTAEIWREVLADEGIVARIRPGDVASFLGVSTLACGLLVPVEDVERAKKILDELVEADQKPDAGDVES